MSTDWGTGSYEPTGHYLLPPSDAVIEFPSLCWRDRSWLSGAGNAALLASGTG
jgi:hypothetical protein